MNFFKKYWIIILITLIIILFIIKKILEEFKKQPTVFYAGALPNDASQQLQQGQGALSTTGVVVSVSDEKLKDISNNLWKKIDGLTWWGWNEPLLQEVLSLSDFDLLRLNTFYKAKSNNDLDNDLESEQTGITTPTGFNSRKIIDRLRNLKK